MKWNMLFWTGNAIKWVVILKDKDSQVTREQNPAILHFKEKLKGLGDYGPGVYANFKKRWRI